MLAENLKKFRKLSGFRQDDVAKIIGLDRSAYAYYEAGKTEPNTENLIKIARMLGVDMNTLLGYEYESDKISMELRSNTENAYSVSDDTQIDELGKCTPDERYIIACYRVCENKQAIIDAVSKLYESEIMG